jgi:cytochrome bd-type quinol oxidase subunit 1
VWALQQLPGPAGIFVPMVTALVVLSAVGRVQRALWVNHRYRFTTWRWGKVFAGLMVIGLVLKLMLGVA